MKPSAKHQIDLRIVVEKPPRGLGYALQKGKGPAYEKEQIQQSTGGDLVFTLTAPATIGPDGTVAVTGPHSQGPPSGRFLYIDIGSYAGQPGAPYGGGRLKIPLTGITAGMLEQGAAFETRVPGSGKDGRPTYATVKPFAGWKALANPVAKKQPSAP